MSDRKHVFSAYQIIDLLRFAAGFSLLLITLLLSSRCVFAETNGYTRDSAVEYVESWVGTGYDVDGSGKYDCVDLAKKYFLDVGGMPYTVVKGNAAGYANSENAIPSGWVRKYLSAGYYPEPGDVAVWGTSYSTYGHVAIIVSVNSSAGTFTCVEQSTNKNRPAFYSNAYSISGPVCFIVPDFVTDPPFYVHFSTDHTRYTANQGITLNYTSDTATSYFLHVFHKGGSEIECIQVSASGTDTYRLPYPGEYTLYIGGANNSGAIASNSVNLTILDARKPSSATLTTITPVCEAGNYARFRYSSDTATHFYLHIFDSNMNEVECVNAPTSGYGAYMLNTPGKYTFYIGVANEYGDLASNSVTVNCVASVAPKTAVFQTETTGIAGVPIQLEYSSDTGTEFYLHVFDDTKREINSLGVSSSGHDEYVIEDAGLYTLYVGTANSKGDLASNPVDVVILSGEGDVLRLPASLNRIEEEAFSGNSIRTVLMQDGVVSIGDYAFSDCGNLELVEIPESVVEIAEHAFEGSENVVIAGMEGSCADEFAQTYGYPFARR